MMGDRISVKPSTPLMNIINTETRQYLHMSGKGFVTGADYAWSGSRAHANITRALLKDLPLLAVEAERAGT